MKILIINGPNLNLLGQREKSQYGELTLQKIEEIINKEFPSDEFTFFQSNHEGEIIDQIQNATENYDALIINPGGYSHTSVAIRDALEVAKLTKIEVHLSNISARDDFRHRSITAPMTDGYLSGFKEKGYLAAVYLIKQILVQK
jgi:3-dehydroquinate dehydratase-2